MITRRNATGSNGRRTSLRRPFLPGRGRSALAGLLFAAASGCLLGQAVKEFKVPYGSTDPRGITVGADGNLWFADYLGFAIGTMTEFPLPCVNPPYCFESIGPYGITVGPDGNLWIAEVAGKIGRATTAGAATNFDIPSSPGKPVYIAAGSDGNLWFTESFANKIGRITTAGKVTEFPIPTANSTPEGIAAGPDGNLWFTEESGNRIARITTAGVLTEFPSLPSPVLPMAITAGPDGNLWFTELGNHIGRITPAGEITEFPLPDMAGGGAFGNGITSGPDGNLWLTRASASEARITRFTPPPPASAERLSTLAPCRLVDTRNPGGPNGGPALRAGVDRLFTLAGACAIPLSARAVAINVTVTEGSAPGHLTAYPAGTTMPIASLINYAAGQTRA